MHQILQALLGVFSELTPFTALSLGGLGPFLGCQLPGLSSLGPQQGCKAPSFPECPFPESSMQPI